MEATYDGKWIDGNWIPDYEPPWRVLWTGRLGKPRRGASLRCRRSNENVENIRPGCSRYPRQRQGANRGRGEGNGTGCRVIVPAPVPRAWNCPPQNQQGPCTVVCGHSQCQRLILKAETCCVLCNQPIGYAASYVELYDGQLFHVDCPPPPVPAPQLNLFQRVMRRIRPRNSEHE